MAGDRPWFEGVAWGNGRFVAVGYRSGPSRSGVILVSSDGVNWQEQPPIGSVGRWDNIQFLQGKFIALGTVSVALSDDGLNWELVDLRSVLPFSSLQGVAFGNGRYVSVGPAGYVFNSEDLKVWNRIAVKEAQSYLNAVIFTGTEFVAVGRGGTIIRSSSGLEWQKDNAPVGLDLYGVAAGGGRLVAVGGRGGILVWPSSTPTGESFSYSEDRDGDGIKNRLDAEPDVPNPPLELYLMGLIPPWEVPDVLIPENARLTGRGLFTATKINRVTIDDIISKDGVRSPDYLHSQNQFTGLAVLLSSEDADLETLSKLDDEIHEFSRTRKSKFGLYNFWDATAGRASLRMDLALSSLKSLAAPRLWVETSQTGGRVMTFRFRPIPGWRHFLQSSRDLLRWTDQRGPFQGDGSPMEVQHELSIESSPQFYRLRISR